MQGKRRRRTLDTLTRQCCYSRRTAFMRLQARLSLLGGSPHVSRSGFFCGLCVYKTSCSSCRRGLCVLSFCRIPCCSACLREIYCASHIWLCKCGGALHVWRVHGCTYTVCSLRQKPHLDVSKYTVVFVEKRLSKEEGNSARCCRGGESESFDQRKSWNEKAE